MGSVPGLSRSYILRSNLACVPQLLSQHSGPHELQRLKPVHLKPILEINMLLIVTATRIMSIVLSLFLRKYLPVGSSYASTLPKVKTTHGNTYFPENVVDVVSSLSLVWLLATPWTISHQDPLTMGFLREEHYSGLPFPSPGDIPDPGIEPMSPELTGGFFTTEPPGKYFPRILLNNIQYI